MLNLLAAGITQYPGILTSDSEQMGAIICLGRSVYIGALDGGSQICRMLILRNSNVPYRYFCNLLVDYKLMSNVACEIKDLPMSYH